jgi:branched-chain amino acid transport system substrate-binding protein
VKIVLRLIAVGFAGLACLGAAGCASKAAPQPIRIGHLSLAGGPLGSAALEQARHGIDLAVAEANEKNGILGRPIVVYHPEPSSDAKDLAAQAVRLITINKVVALLGGSAAAHSTELPNVAQLYNTPLLLPAVVPGQPANDYVFYTGVTPAEAGRCLARLAAARWKSVPFVAQSAGDPSAAPFVSAFVEEFRKKSGKQAEGPTVYQAVNDLKKMLPSLASRSPRPIVVAGTAKDVVELAQAEADKEVPILWGAITESVNSIREARIAPAVYAVTVDSATASEAAAFGARYQKQFGNPADMHARQAYDDARILFAAIRQSEHLDGPALEKAFVGLKNVPILTGTISFNPDHVAARPLFIVRVQGGQTETAPAPTEE